MSGKAVALEASVTLEELSGKGFQYDFCEYDGGHYIPDEGLRVVESWIQGIKQ